jgi:hypothetical protein
LKKRGNQIRVVDPDGDNRIKAIAQAVATAGYPESLAATLAEGFIARLRRRVYAALDDLIGDGDDVEALCGWKGPPRYLSAALLQAGYIRDIHGVYVMGDAVNEAPEYVKKRWQRANRPGYEEAVKRCGKPNVANQRMTVPGDEDDYDYEGEMKKEADMHNTQGSLFGIEPDQPGEKHVAITGFTQFKEAYHAAYLAAYGHAYPWRPRDFKEIERIVAALADANAYPRLIAAFLACRDKFYAGHELRKLYTDLAKFVASAGKVGSSAGSNAALRTHGRPEDAVIRPKARRSGESPQQ